MLINDGIPTREDLDKVTPSDKRFAEGATAIVECFQEIPCDPCVKACARGAITLSGKDINALPIVDETLCNGCGLCISLCPGLAIFVVDKTYSEKLALVKLPYECLPVPLKGQHVTGLNRAGEKLGSFEVISITSGATTNKTHTITLAVPQEQAMDVRCIQAAGTVPSACPPACHSASQNANIICRCEDVTREDILACIKDGCETIDEVKRVTRAGMGSCQGRTCRSLIAAELARYYNIPVEEILLPTFRPPGKAISLGMLADAHDQAAGTVPLLSCEEAQEPSPCFHEEAQEPSPCFPGRAYEE